MTLFDKLYGITKEDEKKEKKPFQERKLKRAIAAAADAIEIQILELEGAELKSMQDLINADKPNVVGLLEIREKIATAKRMVTTAKGLDAEIFGAK